jgi:predicted nuclease of predicted toxin-antitoxin system
VKRILFDENMPRKLRRDLPDLYVRTVQEEGWAGFENGQLLRRAAGNFDILLTADQRMRHQQNIKQFEIGVVVVETFDTTLENLRRLLPLIRQALEQAANGDVLIVRPPLPASGERSEE